ncbi:MAG: GNAT family N-acetyltransferase [Dermatophilaceae bacterium]
MTDLLATFHAQIRLRDRDATPGNVIESVGLVRRNYPSDPSQAGAMIESPEGLGDDPDAAIAQQRDFFLGRGQRVEWKTYSYDPPADLGARLSRAGFRKEDDEALLLGELTVLAEAVVPQGFLVREAAGRTDHDRIAALHELIWPGSAGTTGSFVGEQADSPGDSAAVLALAEDDPDGAALCAAWVRRSPGTDFAGMWGGATHPDFRGRGLYGAVLAARARWALDRGHTLARVDASPMSEPILRRLGLLRVATTVPYILDPAEALSFG